MSSLIRSSKHSSRHFSFSRFLSAFSSEEYPSATEPPVISQTTASKARLQPPKLPDIDYMTREKPNIDLATLERLRKEQKKALNTKLSRPTEITPDIPSNIPPNVSKDELGVPEQLITTLDNGVRVVSHETYGLVSTVGVVSSVGSRLEDIPEAGVTHLLELLAFGATPQYSGSKVAELLQDWGATRYVSTQREQSLHCIDLLRPNVPKAMDLLRQVLLEPRFLPEEVEDAKRAAAFQVMDMPPEIWLSEAIQAAAYGMDQQLGHPHLAQDVSNITPETIHDFWRSNFVENPSGIVIGGAGVKHDSLVRLAEENFGHLEQGDNVHKVVRSTYKGGDCKIQLEPPDQFVRVGLAFSGGGWHSKDLVAICVLQTLLGGGSSFSAGGPGKGMYSRLYRQVLNRYSWAEGAECFTAFHEDAGLWGIMGSTQPDKARDLIQVFAEQLAQLVISPVSDEELARARNMLKGNVLTQLESRLVIFEDLSRQVLTYGKREDIYETCKKIDAVTQEDLQRVAQQALSLPASVAAVGEDLSKVPHQSEVLKWFGWEQ